MARLRVIRGGKEVGTVELGDKDVRLGRAPENDVVLEDSGTAVSRYHAELRVVGDAHVLVNLSQPFGVWASGQRVERVVMAPGVEVAVGPFRLVVDGAARSTTSTASVPAAAVVAPAPTVPSAGGAAAAAPAGVVVPIDTPRLVATSAHTRTAAETPGRPSAINWVVYGGVAAGLVAVVWLAQLISPATLTRPAPVEAASAGAAGAIPSDDAVRAQLTAARDAIERGQPDVALRDLQSLLAKAPEHAEALALKTRAEEAVTSPSASADAGPSPTATAVNAGTTASTAAPSAAVPGGPTTAGAPRRAVPVAPAAPATAGPNAKPLLQRPGTRDPAFAGRNADVVRRFLQAETAYKAGQYRLAISNLQSVLRSDATFPTAEAKLEEVKTTVRDMAEAAFAEGGRLEKAGDFAGAIRSYEKSQEIATMMYGVMTGATEAIARVRETMVATGVDAFKKARQYDALGRVSDAVAMYVQAVEYLPQDDPNRQVAQERLGALKR